MIRIIVDSSSDYQLEELKQKNMELVPISVTIGDPYHQAGGERYFQEYYRGSPREL